MYSAFKEFYNLLSQVNSVYHDAALKLGLTDSELDILYSLNEHGSVCNQSIFYKETGTTKSTINSAVRRMEQAGYLYLKPGTGRNTWCCTIKVDIENSKGQYIEKDKQEATKDGSESTKIQHGI